jgi:O-antigen ligase
MSRRKDKAKLAPSIRHSVTPPFTPGQDLVRRVLLGLVTALVVARPLVATEDPGLRSPLPDPSGMVLTWLWLVALLGWAVWRLWTRQGGVRFGLVDGALLVLVGLNVLSAATAARYKYAAWIVTWEWLSFFVVLYLVRRLATWPGASDGLLAALLASAVMLSVYAAYQYVVEIPANAALTPAQIEAQMAEEGLTYAPDDFKSSQLMERARSPNVFATFGHPNSFGGYVGLLLPIAVGLTLAGWRAGGWTWQTELLVACTGLMALALWWTQSRGAILATLFVAAIAAFWLGRRLLTLRRLRALAGLAALSLVIGGIAYAGLREAGTGKVAPGASISLRLGYWNATWKMIREQPWLGVGPGNFGRHYPAYMSETDYEEVQNPHNFLLELWATCGFLGMAVLLAVLGIFLRRIIRQLTSVPAPAPLPDTAIKPRLAAAIPPRQTEANGENITIEHGQRTPWEFYLGGMAGLVLGFFLEAWHLAADEQIVHGTVAAVRSLFWFPAFALFSSVRWPGPSRAAALVAGILVLLLNLCVSDGISVPAVATPLWVVVALVVASWDAQAKRVAAPAAEPGGQFAFLCRVLAIPACAVVVMVYLALFLFPTIKGTDLALQSLRAQQYLRMYLAPPGGTAIPAEWALAIRRDRVGFVRQQILKPLLRAVEANPEDARYLRTLALWTGVVWQMTQRDADREAASRHALHVQGLDPVSRDGWLAEAELSAMFGRPLQLEAWTPTLAVSTPWGPFANLQLPPQPLGTLVLFSGGATKNKAALAAQAQFDRAAKALAEAVRLGPTQIQIRFRLVIGLQAAGDSDEAEREARQLLRIDDKSTQPSRHLSTEQRKQVQRWLLDRADK